MKAGFVMLAHENLRRGGQVARHLARQGAPVAVHIDIRASASDRAGFRRACEDDPNIYLMPSRRSDWGTWSLIEVSRDAAGRLLAERPDLTHVVLISGSCLPLRPVAELEGFLGEHPGTDFIESVSVKDVPWIQGGLGSERFHYSFPFPWRRMRWAFDRWTRLQQRMGRRRRPPSGIAPHLGSQWWCLTRSTLTAILDDPDRRRQDRYFRRVWIPDESYFQTLVRRHASRIVSRSLTHTRFDWKGRPNILYDDHLPMLADLDAFFVRKVWAGADRLYRAFLSDDPSARAGPPAAAEDVDVWADAQAARTLGRPGVLNAGRFPWRGYPGALSPAPYHVLSGYEDFYEDFDAWLRRLGDDLEWHPRPFAPEGAVFADEAPVTRGGLASSPALRDYNPEGFLLNLLRGGRTRQAIGMHPGDSADLWPFLTRDPHARIFAIRGAFFGALSEEPACVARCAARLQAREERAMGLCRPPAARAEVAEWSLAQAMADPAGPIRELLASLGIRRPVEMPAPRPRAGLERFLAALDDAGITPRVTGGLGRGRLIGAGEADLSARDHG